MCQRFWLIDWWIEMTSIDLYKSVATGFDCELWLGTVGDAAPRFLPLPHPVIFFSLHIPDRGAAFLTPRDTIIINTSICMARWQQRQAALANNRLRSNGIYCWSERVTFFETQCRILTHAIQNIHIYFNFLQSRPNLWHVYKIANVMHVLWSCSHSRELTNYPELFPWTL